MQKKKPKEQIEINLTQVREPQNLKEAKASSELVTLDTSNK